MNSYHVMIRIGITDTNSYHTNSHITIRIKTWYEFISYKFTKLICRVLWIRMNLRLVEKNEKLPSPKKGIPPWAQVWGNLYILYQIILDTIPKCTRKAKTPSEIWDGTISFVRHSIVNPICFDYSRRRYQTGEKLQTTNTLGTRSILHRLTHVANINSYDM